MIQSAINIDTLDGVFQPTLSSELLLKTMLSQLSSVRSLLDLGCGSGLMSVHAGLAENNTLKQYASDISELAVELARKNLAAHHVDALVKCGSLFSPWRAHHFDLIVSSVSGIADRVAQLSPWFNVAIPCEAGVDGTELTIAILAQAADYLTSNGRLIFPVISLSDEAKILTCARQRFATVRQLNYHQWMLPASMLASIEVLREWRQQGYIDFDEKFGTCICWTSVYSCEETV